MSNLTAGSPAGGVDVEINSNQPRKDSGRQSNEQRTIGAVIRAYAELRPKQSDLGGGVMTDEANKKGPESTRREFLTATTALAGAALTHGPGSPGTRRHSRYYRFGKNCPARSPSNCPGRTGARYTGLSLLPYSGGDVQQLIPIGLGPPRASRLEGYRRKLGDGYHGRSPWLPSECPGVD